MKDDSRRERRHETAKNTNTPPFAFAHRRRPRRPGARRGGSPQPQPMPVQPHTHTAHHHVSRRDTRVRARRATRLETDMWQLHPLRTAQCTGHSPPRAPRPPLLYPVYGRRRGPPAPRGATTTRHAASHDAAPHTQLHAGAHSPTFAHPESHTRPHSAPQRRAGPPPQAPPR